MTVTSIALSSAILAARMRRIHLSCVEPSGARRTCRTAHAQSRLTKGCDALIDDGAHRRRRLACAHVNRTQAALSGLRVAARPALAQHRRYAIAACGIVSRFARRMLADGAPERGREGPYSVCQREKSFVSPRGWPHGRVYYRTHYIARTGQLKVQAVHVRDARASGTRSVCWSPDTNVACVACTSALTARKAEAEIANTVDRPLPRVADDARGALLGEGQRHARYPARRGAHVVIGRLRHALPSLEQQSRLCGALCCTRRHWIVICGRGRERGRSRSTRVAHPVVSERAAERPRGRRAGERWVGSE
jgi:hypothetical protein